MKITTIDEKRKEKKSLVSKPRERKLEKGERKRSSGNYEYRYTGEDGKRHSVYAKTIQELDEKKKRIKVDEYYGISPKDYTLNKVYLIWKKHKLGVKENTLQNWCYMYEKYVQDTNIGKAKIKSIRMSEIQSFYEELVEVRSLSVSTVDSIHTVIHSILEYAIKDDLIRKNPASSAFKDVKRRFQKSNKRIALTRKQQEEFLTYLAKNEKFSRWWSVFAFMLETGLRVGECVGLTYEDIEGESVSVNHTLVYFSKYTDDKKCYYEIHPPKTTASIRSVPLSKIAKKALQFEKEYQKNNQIKCNSSFRGTKVVSGKIVEQEFNDFVFLNRFGEVFNQNTLNKAIRRIVEEYNSELERKTKGQCSEDDKLPRFSCHILRHTYITRLCEGNINPRVIMELAGHSTMDTTMQIYTTISKDFAQKVFKSFEEYLEEENLPQIPQKIPHE